MTSRETLGLFAKNMSPATATRSPIHNLPPLGAARLTGDDREFFTWEPVGAREWEALSPAERGSILIDRGSAWIRENGALTESPIAFVADSSAVDATEQLFGIRVSSIQEAICALHALLRNNPIKGRALIILLGPTLFLITGLDPLVYTPEIAELLLETYASQCCQ